MARIIIEEVNRLGHVTGRHCYDHLPVSVGRGYQNDLIIGDPYVSSKHIIINDAAIETEDTVNEATANNINSNNINSNNIKICWTVEDLQSDNGVKYRSHSPQSKTQQLVSGDEIIIGRTRLRLLSPQHPVAKTHLLPTKASLPRIIAQPGIAVGTVIFAMFLLLLDAQLSIAAKTGFEKLLAHALPTFIFALMWAGVWTFVGRVITHRASFVPHFIAALMVFIISMLTATMSEYLTYNLSDKLLAALLELLIVGFTIAGLIYINLTNSTNVSKRSSLITSHSVAWSMLLMGLFMQFVNKPEFSHSPEYVSQLKPPFAKIAPSKTLDEFFKESEALFIKDSD
jgi:hypothetical protein